MIDDIEGREIINPTPEQAASVEPKTPEEGKGKETEDKIKDPTTPPYMNQDSVLSLSKDSLKTKDKSLKNSPDQSPSDQLVIQDSDRISGASPAIASKLSVSEVLTEVEKEVEKSKTIGEERSREKKNPVILAGVPKTESGLPSEGATSAHLPATVKRVELAATLRAEGASWKETAQVMKRKSSNALRKLPGRYPDLWGPAYRRAIQRVMTRGHSEAFLTLRRRLKDGDGKVSVQAARGILQHIERMTTKTIKHVGKIEHEHSVRDDRLQGMELGGLEGLLGQLVG